MCNSLSRDLFAEQGPGAIPHFQIKRDGGRMSASAIRAALTSHTAVEKFDVDKVDNAAQALALITAAFDEPIGIDGPAKGPIPKATLVVGAGKLDRAVRALPSK